ncbi:DUF3552 domain-containing protein [Patescibacteria group bacterium]|nr:DUF3552 domain-containing protein [Patescibacteria group bacterium]MBU1703471.1 DUF3552 domain-containing protein [Patescibacteria group bacterium]MBU1953447.1 DUF3552 domain-containing protein [Patescibacteria group bacterium]
MPNLLIILASLGAAAIGGGIGYFLSNAKKDLTIESYKEKADKKIEKAKTEAAVIKEEADRRSQSLIQKAIEDEARLKEQFKKREQLIISKEEQVKRRETQVQEVKSYVNDIISAIEEVKKENDRAKQQFAEKLSKKTGITPEKAREQALENLARDLELMREERLRKYEEYLEEDKMRLAKDILVGAIQRYSAPTSVEKRSLAIVVPRDDMKAKILGVDARHLHILEELTECEIVFNDAPNTIIISCLDLVKKHIARETVMKLINERVVNEAKVRQTIELVQKEMEQLLIKIGKDTIKQLGMDKRKYSDNFYRTMGRLQFRTSYGQNIMKHSLEVGYMTLMIAGEIGADMGISRVAGFFHDLGKAIDHEVGEPHDQLTRKIMEESGGFSHEEIHAAWNHHDAIAHESAESMLVKAADAISAGRPGARQETLEKFLEHIRMIEGVANSYEGVKKTYAISAGRELRVFVEPQELDDEHLPELARSIAGEIQEQKAYPGKVKVNIIRRTNSVEYAKKK